MSSDPGVRQAIRRLKPQSRRERLQYREKSQLPWIRQTSPVPKLLLDTTVYIDQLQGKLPRDVEISLRAGSLWHSSVTECELAALAGLLDPARPGSAQAVEEVLASIARRPAHRVVNPDREIWRDAGILAGLLARLQQYGKAEQRRALNDALIFLSAAKSGLTVLTRNISDYDLLLQLASGGSALFYEI